MMSPERSGTSTRKARPSTRLRTVSARPAALRSLSGRPCGQNRRANRLRARRLRRLRAADDRAIRSSFPIPSSSLKSCLRAPRQSITAASSAAISRCRASSTISFSIPTGGWSSTTSGDRRRDRDARAVGGLGEARPARLRGRGRGDVPAGFRLEPEQRQPGLGVLKTLAPAIAGEGALDWRRLVERVESRNCCPSRPELRFRASARTASAARSCGP